MTVYSSFFFFFFQAEDGIRDYKVTGVQTCALPISTERERASIAREIHDDIGGSLTSVKFDVAWIARNAPEGGLREHALAALEMLRSEERRVGKECRSRWSPYH